jgi:hypothetical protein
MRSHSGHLFSTLAMDHLGDSFVGVIHSLTEMAFGEEITI